MIDFWIVLGAVGSVASLAGVLLPSQSRRQRWIHVLYGIAIVVVASTAAWYWQANQRIHKVEQAAQRLLSESEYNFTNAGFIQAALAFLEKNKDLYPDSYSRAQELCKQNNCSGAQYSKEASSAIDHEHNLRNVASTLRGLVKGISALEAEH
ncbi:hypothetical protein O0881_20945 [Janthinobacterium sp. SUN100]|nr:hypothetical protein [Janthinobacterium sp. SUN100]